MVRNPSFLIINKKMSVLLNIGVRTLINLMERLWLSFLMLMWLTLSSHVGIMAQNKVLRSGNDSGKKYQSLSKCIDSLPPSFFVFTVNTCLSSNSNSPAIIQNYNVIKRKLPEKKILMVLNSACGVNKDNLSDYLQNDFRIDLERDTLLHVIINDSLYQELSEGLFISKLLYFNNGELLYDYDTKWHFADEKVLPTTLVSISFDEKIPLLTGDFRNSMNNDFYELSYPYILQVSDVNNRVDKIDIRSGKMTDILDLSGYNATELYFKLISHDSNSYEYANKFKSILDSIKRLTLPIVLGFQSGDSIFLSGGIQVFTKVKERLKYKDVYGNKFFIEPGELFAYNYSIIYHCDSNLRINGIYYVDDSTYPGKAVEMYLTGSDFASYAEDSFLYLFNTPEYMFKSKWYLKYKNHALSAFVKRGDQYAFKEFLNVPYPRNFKKASDFSLFYKIFPYRNRLYFHYDLWPQIYNVKTGELVAKLTGDGSKTIKSRFPKHMTDTGYPEVPFYIYASGKILKDYYAFIYLFNNSKILLEIFDKNWNSLQVIDISNLEGMEKVNGIKYDSSNLVMYKDGFAHLQYDGMKFYLYKYKFKSLLRPFSYFSK